MASPRIRSKRSSVEGKVPAASQLMRGEFAVNSYDGKVYILKDQTSVGIATTTVTVNPWDEPNGVGAGVSYSSDVNVLGVVTATSFVGDVTGDVTGIATGATRVLVDESEDDNHFYNILFTDVTPGAGDQYHTLQVDNGGLRFNPATNVFEVQKVEAYNYVASQAYYDIDNAGSSYNFDSNGDAGILTNGTPNLVVGVDGNTRVTNSLNVSGVVTATSFVGDGSGLTNINVAGISTFSGNYNHLYNKPTIPTNNNQLTNGAGYITGYTVTESDVTGHQAALSITESQISDFGTYASASSLATVATSGSYNDLSNTPTIPTNNNQLTNGAGYITGYTVTESDVTGHQAALSITESQISDFGTYATAASVAGIDTSGFIGAGSTFSGNYNHLYNKPTIPTNNNQLTNGAGYITGYTVTQSDVTGHQAALSITESQISDLGTYLTSSDLSSYATTSYVDTEVAGLVDSAPGTLNTLNELAAALGDDANFSTTVTNSIAGKLPLSGGTMTGNITFSSGQTFDYNNLTNKPTIPTNNNQLTNGAGYITSFDITTQTDSKYLRSNASDTTSGDLTIQKTNPNLILKGTGTSTGNYPSLRFNTGNNQGVMIEHNEFDSELPIAGYGLVVTGDDDNTQFPSTGTLSFSVLGNIYAGGTSLSGVSRVLTTADEGSGNGIDADTVDGVQASSFLRSDADDSFSGTITGTSDSTNPVFTIDGGGPNIVRFLDNGSATTGIDLVFRTSPNTLGFEKSTDGTKLWETDCDNGVTNFSFTPTVSGNTVWHAGNDGAGSGLDADMLDGSHGADYLDYNNFTNTPTIPTNNNQLTNGAGYITSFDITTQTDSKYLRSDVDDTSTGRLTLQRGFTSDTDYHLYIRQTTNGEGATIRFVDDTNATQNGYFTYKHFDSSSNSAANSFHFNSSENSTAVIIDQTAGNSGFYVGTNKVWHAGNDGSGSGLDADTVDGIQASSFLRSNANDSFSGNLTGSGTILTTGTYMGIKGDGGGVVMTTNDGYGNANLCFNHQNGVPDKTGSSCRIETSVDNSTGFMLFEVGNSVTSGTAVTLTEILKLATAEISANRSIIPYTNNTRDLGSSSKRWRNVYTNDLNLSNEGGANDVDGTWGDWTMQEGENDMFMINNRTGNKFRIKLEPV